MAMATAGVCTSCNGQALCEKQREIGVLLKRHARPVTKVDFVDRWVVSSSKGSDVVLSCAKCGAEQRRFVAARGAVNDLCLSTAASTLIVGLADSTIWIWNIESGKPVLSWEREGPVTAVETDSESRYIWAVVRVLGKSDVQAWLERWSTDNGSVSPAIRVKLLARSRAIRLVGDGRYLLVGDDDGSLHRFDAKTLERIDTCALHSSSCNEIRRCRVQTWVVTASSDRRACILDWTTMKPVHYFDSPVAVNTAALHPRDDEILLAGGQEARNVTTTHASLAHFELQFFDQNTKVRTAELKTQHFGPIHSLAYNTDGTSLVTGSEDGFIRLQTILASAESRRREYVEGLKHTLQEATSKNHRRRVRRRLKKVTAAWS